MTNEKAVKIKPRQYEQIVKLGHPDLPFWAKLDLALSNEPQKREVAKLPKTKPEPGHVSEVRKAFLEAHFKEFNRHYTGWGARENGMAANWLKSVSLDTAIRLCRVYFKWNDAWVARQGFTFGILVSQYVKLDAWAGSSDKLIQKIASGTATERVKIRRAIDHEEMKIGVSQRYRQGRKQEIEDAQHTSGVSRLIPSSPPQGVHREHGDPFSPEIFNQGSEVPDGNGD